MADKRGNPHFLDLNDVFRETMLPENQIVLVLSRLQPSCRIIGEKHHLSSISIKFRIL